MTDLAGRQFTRPTLTDYLKYYYIGGNALHRNIPFRVCANSTNCDLSQGEYVPEAGKWYLQDQKGSEEKPTADFVGVNAGNSGAWWLVRTNSGTKTDQAPFIVSFTAKLKCLFGKCAPCVRLESNTSNSPAGRLGIMPWVGTGTEASLGEAFILVGNNNSCFPIIFQETTCEASL